MYTFTHCSISNSILILYTSHLTTLKTKKFLMALFNMRTHEIFSSLLLGLFFAFSTWIVLYFRFSTWFPNVDDSSYSQVYGGILIVLAGLFGTALALLVFNVLPAALQKLNRHDLLKRFSLKWNKTSIIQATILLWVLWLPFIILQYPGGISFDTYNQIYQFIAPAPTYYDTLGVYYDAEFIDHHPLLDTLLFGIVFSLGSSLGSQSLGLFFNVLLQILLNTIALAASCCYLEKLAVSKVVRLISFVFCAFFPFVPLWATTVVKDSLHMPFFIIFFICYIETFRSNGRNLMQPKWLTALVVTSFMTIMTKKTGTIIVLPALLALTIYLFANTKNKKLAQKDVRLRMLTGITSIVTIAFIVPPLLYPLLGGVAPGGLQEAFGMPLQQVVSVINTENDLTKDEIKVINGVLNTEKATQQWNALTVDGVKSCAKSDTSTSDWMHFCITYLQIGLRHPITYTKTCLNVVCDYFGPGTCMAYYRSSYPGWQYNHFNEIYNNELQRINFSFELFPPETIAQADFVVASAIQQWSLNPLFTFFFSIGLWGSWIPVLCILMSVTKDKTNLIAFFPIILSIAILFFCPAARTRYILPLLFTSILQFGLLHSALSRTRE